MNRKANRTMTTNAAKRIDITSGDAATFYGQPVYVLNRISPKRAEVLFRDGKTLTVYVSNLIRTN